MLRALISLAILGLVVYAVIDCARTPADQVKHLPKPIWLVLILLTTVVGSLAWLVVGRPPAPSAPPRSYSGTAPDDDPDFLWSLRRKPRDPKDDA